MEKQEVMELLKKYDEAVASFSLSKTMQASEELRSAIRAIFTADQFADIMAAGPDRVVVMQYKRGDRIYIIDPKVKSSIRVTRLESYLIYPRKSGIDILVKCTANSSWHDIKNVHPDREAALAAKEGTEQ